MLHDIDSIINDVDTWQELMSEEYEPIIDALIEAAPATRPHIITNCHKSSDISGDSSNDSTSDEPIKTTAERKLKRITVVYEYDD